MALSKADAALAGKSYQEAVELYTKALEEGGNDADAYLGRAKAHNRLEQHMEAVADAQKAAELSPQLAAAHAEQGRALYELEEYESAKEAFDKASVLEPARKIHKNWANMCLSAMGQELREVEGQRRAADVASLLAAGGASAQRSQRTEPATEKASTSVSIDDPEYNKYWGARPASAVAAAVAAESPASGARYRHQWFQSGDKVEVDILAKGLPKDRVRVEFHPRRLHVVTAGAGGEAEYELDLELHSEIDPGASRYEVLGTKIEIRLKKADAAAQWPALEAAAGAAPAAAAAAAAAAPPPPVVKVSPYSGKTGQVDWDSLEQAVKEEEKNETLDGDAGAMRFFRSLYGDADEDTRRAMLKSYQESGGTSLSTSWKDVGSRSFEVAEAPEGAELRRFES